MSFARILLLEGDGLIEREAGSVCIACEVVS